MSWTDERVALLKKLWVEGRTAAEIAKELGDVTRNAVIGKAHRLKLSNRISPIQQNPKKPVKANDDKPVQKASPVARVVRAPVNVKGIPLTELKERMCRWPLGDPREADFKFCGCDTALGLPYCEDHARIAYQVASRNRVLKAEDLEGGNRRYAEDGDDSKEAVGA